MNRCVWLEEKPTPETLRQFYSFWAKPRVTQQDPNHHVWMSRMKFREENNPLGPKPSGSQAVPQVVTRCGATVRSIIVSANQELCSSWRISQVLRLRCQSDKSSNLLQIFEQNRCHRETETQDYTILCHTDSDIKSITSLSVYYTTIFRVYYRTDFNCGGNSPIHVDFLCWTSSTTHVHDRSVVIDNAKP